MCYRSPQRELHSAFFSKGMKHYFGEIFGQISSPKSSQMKFFHFFKRKSFFLQIKMSEVVFSSLEFWT